jgi:hypothetical protein
MFKLFLIISEAGSNSFFHKMMGQGGSEVDASSKVKAAAAVLGQCR